MQLVDATSDSIESFFGIHDLVSSTMSKNTSFHVTSAISTWKHNRTSVFLHTLSVTQLEHLLLSAVKNGRRLKREADKREKKAAIHKLKHLKEKAQATRESEKRMIKDIQCLRNETLFKTVRQYQDFVHSIGNNYKLLLKELKKQIRLLRKVHAHDYAQQCIYMCVM